jgi:hypothetical protein
MQRYRVDGKPPVIYVENEKTLTTTTTTTTQNGQLWSFDALGNLHPYLRQIKETRAEHKEDRTGPPQRRDGEPPNWTFQGIHRPQALQENG